ncbi:Coiled-coil domain-containing protein [Schistosoma japonicum]|uniref:Coiled-coil domain-containing protein n=1 Tax=Schistosoma japonicum TaxID=6182 RepID=A0A4Z2D320_SCHJA|nr:Coiled-coil domain-containing protein [Schistosoma japonicum]
MLPNKTKSLVKNLMNYPTVIKQSAIDSYEKLKSMDYRSVYEVYDHFTGLDRVRSLHVGVAEAERNFVQKQIERRSCQMKVFQLEEARNRINVQLDSVKRSDENFLKLVTELHDLSRQHQRARDQLTSVELAEQVAFEHFSSTLRHSQAEERIQANRMRQWTVGFSLAAGLIGFGATFIRFRQLDKQTKPLHLTATGQTIDYSFQDLTSSLQSSDQRLRTALDDLNIMKDTLNDKTCISKTNLLEFTPKPG